MVGKWHKPVALIIALIVNTTVLTNTIFKIVEGYEASKLCVLIFSNVVIILLWIRNRSLPVTEKNKIGFVVCVSCSDDAIADQVREDFSEAIYRAYKNSPTGHLFHFINIPNRLALKYKTIQDAIELKEKARAQFLLHGVIRPRKQKGQTIHTIDIEAHVSHSALPAETARIFKRLITRTWANKINLSSPDEDIRLYDITSNLVTVSTKYIIALASLVSGDLSTAKNLLHELAHAPLLLDNSEGPNPISELRESVLTHLDLIAESEIHSLYEKWRKDRCIQTLTSARDKLQELNTDEANSHQYWTIEAISLVVLDHSYDEAADLLEKVPTKLRDGIWMCNMAFLLALQGNLQKAYKLYNKASHTPLEAGKINELEEFMVWFLEQHKRAEIYFLMGLLNLKLKRDFISAERDLDLFLKYCPADRYKEQRDWCTKIIGRYNAAINSE